MFLFFSSFLKYSFGFIEPSLLLCGKSRLNWELSLFSLIGITRFTPRHW